MEENLVERSCSQRCLFGKNFRHFSLVRLMLSKDVGLKLFFKGESDFSNCLT